MFFDSDDHEFEEEDRSDLLTRFDELHWDTELLALKSVQNVQVPVCGFLSQLSSADCFKLLLLYIFYSSCANEHTTIKYELDDWSNKNQPSDETILLHYLVTDYICCGLSSPGFHVEFNKTLQSNKSKYKLLKDLILIWDCLFKSHKVTSLNVAFIKQLIVSLNYLFVKILKFIPDYNIIWKWENLMDKIKHNVEEYEINTSNSKVVFTSRNNIMQQNNSLQEKVLSIQNTVPKQTSESKVNMFKKTPIDQKNAIKAQNMERTQSHQQNNFEHSADHHQSKKLKLITNDEENAKPDSIVISEPPPSEQKLNVFQLMMLNAKKRKAHPK